MVPTKHQTRHVPVTAEEIAADAERCRQAGASIVHVHARDADGRPTWRPEAYAEIIARIRARCPELIICVSTSGRTFQEPEKRAAVLSLDGDVRPDMASLTLGSLNFPQQASINPPEVIRDLAATMNERGILPELEAFDVGMIDYARYLIGKQVLRPPYYFNLFLGSLGSISASPERLAGLIAALPEGAHWGAAGIGRYQTYVNNLAVAAGGHVRIGIEDNIWYDSSRTQLATNPGLVARIAGVADSMGREIADPAETRALLGMAG